MSKPSNKATTSRVWYSVPAPVRRVFDQFPLVTHSENSLPQRTRRKANQHTLYIFRHTLDSSNKGLSCNPACLKWQAYLKFNDIDFVTSSSNNHASPSGSLPFILPAPSSKDVSPSPISMGKILRWTSQQTMQEEDRLSTEQEVYKALIDGNIRNAWLYHLYLDTDNFATVAHPLYVRSASSNRFVQATIASQLRNAAQMELLKSMSIIDRDDILVAATKAFKALATLLGSKKYFSNDEQPGLFDASVFSYTYLLLDESLPWKDTTLSDLLHDHPVLIEHMERALKHCMS